MMREATMSPLCCFAIISPVLFITMQCTIHVGASQANQPDSEPSITNDINKAASINHEMNGRLSAERVNDLLHSNESFLVREDTPVWIAYYTNSLEIVNYEKLEEYRVKEAVDYWNSEEFEDLPIVDKSKRDDLAFDTWSPFSTKALERDEMVIWSDRNKMHGREENESLMEVAHLSILITMDYVENWPADKKSQEKLINHQILYAIAFWNAVDIQLRDIREPQVRLRMSGIIIGAHPKATPYVYENREGNRIKMDRAYASMLEYWIEQARSYQDFPLTGYHVVATMTNSTPAGFSHPYAASSFGPPCEESDRNNASKTDDLASRKRKTDEYTDDLAMYELTQADIGGIIFSDDLAFGGVQVAVRETAHTLGAIIHRPTMDYYACADRYVMAGDFKIIGRKWSQQSLQEISDRMYSNGWCLEKPREFEQSGKPIELILPGLLVSASNQCRAQKFSNGEVCWNRSSCSQLYCKKHLFCWHWCSNSGPVLDGTISITGKMCLGKDFIEHSEIIDAAISRQEIHSRHNT